MSIEVVINVVALDNVTVLDLSTGFTRSATGGFAYTPPNPVGIIDLQTLPGIGQADVKIERLWVAPQVGAPVAQARIEFPGGGTQLFMDQGAAFPFDGSQWAVLMPQGTRLLLTQGLAPNAALVLMHLQAYGHKEWPDFQCCHRFTPRTGVATFNQANPQPPVNV